MTQKYGKVSMSLGRIKKTYVKKAVPEGQDLRVPHELLLNMSLFADDHPHFLRHAIDLANVLRNNIFVDQVPAPLLFTFHFFYRTTLGCLSFVQKARSIGSSRRAHHGKYRQGIVSHPADLANSNLANHLFKIGKSYYRQTVGIPQGSVLSSILCSFFYGDMEKKFSRFTEDPQSVRPTSVIDSPSVLTIIQALLRLIDDYLFVTTNRKLAVDFLEMMKKGTFSSTPVRPQSHYLLSGHPEYGCFISQEKTLTNFDHSDQVYDVLDPSQRSEASSSP